VFIPENVIIRDNVFIGPGTVFTNDKYAPSKGKWRNEPPTIVEDNVTIGANSTILPNIVIKEGTRVGAGSVVTKSTESNSLIFGNPAKCQ
jgi:acetyltransferase-like isoleucine patch superfamily enzyme